MRRLFLILALTKVYGQSPEVQSLLDQAKALTDQQHFDDAVQLTERAIALSHAANDRTGEAAAYVRLSNVDYWARKLPDGLAAAQQAQALAQSVGSAPLLSAALGIAGSNLRDLGRIGEARAAFEQQLALIRASGDRPAEVVNLRMTALLYKLAGDTARALSNAKACLHLANELKDTVAQGEALFTLGVIEEDLAHQPRAALDHLTAALETPGLPPIFQSQIRQALVSANSYLKRYDEAARIAKQQVDFATATGTRYQIAWAYNKLREPQGLMGARQDAYESAHKALTILQSIDHDPYEECYFLSAVGYTLHELGRPRDAVPYLQRAIEIYEVLRQGLLPGEAQLAQAAAFAKAHFDLTIDCLFDFDPAAALQTFEQSRARAFLKILAESQVDVRQNLAPADRQKEAELSSRIRALHKELWRPNLTAAVAEQKNRELTEAESDWDTFRLDLRKTNPRLAALQYPSPLSMKALQQVLKPGQVLLEFALGEKRSFVWAVSRSGFVSAALAPGKDIEAQIMTFRKAITAPVSGLTAAPSEAEIKSLGARLYTTLLRPVERAFTDASELILVPDGSLYYLPLEAMVTPATRTYLIERFPISYAASATSYAQAGHEPAPPQSNTLLAFGAPSITSRQSSTQRGFDLGPLPYTRDEVQEIAALFPPTQRKLYLGAAAREASLDSESLHRYRYIHFATHGFLDEWHPGRSGLALTPGPSDAGILRVDTITALRLNAAVVTLSACNTGLGQLASGEGMLGLVRAFLYAGAATVNVSLWSVNDAATPALMKQFYGNLLRSLTPAQALRGSQIAMLHQENALWRHPHYWAAFVLWLR